MNSAASPAAQTIHINPAATDAVGVDQLSSASASAVPMVTGSKAQVMRAHHTQNRARFVGTATGAVSYESWWRNRH
jgi:hypothetical protein